MRRVPLRARNPKRRAREWARAYDSPEFVEWGKMGQCCVCGAIGTPYKPNHNHHTKPEGELPVGTGRKADAKWVVVLCSLHHSEAHEGEESFGEKYGINLADEARKHWAKWRDRE